MNELRWS